MSSGSLLSSLCSLPYIFQNITGQITESLIQNLVVLGLSAFSRIQKLPMTTGGYEELERVSRKIIEEFEGELTMKQEIRMIREEIGKLNQKFQISLVQGKQKQEAHFDGGIQPIGPTIPTVFSELDTKPQNASLKEKEPTRRRPPKPSNFPKSSTRSNSVPKKADESELSLNARNNGDWWSSSNYLEKNEEVTGKITTMKPPQPRDRQNSPKYQNGQLDGSQMYFLFFFQ